MSDNQQQFNPSVFFFPLRSNSQFFDSPKDYLSLKERVKQAAVLYDFIIFEAGYYQASVWPTNSAEICFPYGALTREQREGHLTKFAPNGGEETLSMTFAGREAPFVISGEVSRRFHSEFHTIWEELEAHRHPWMRMFNIELKDEATIKLKEMEKIDIEDKELDKIFCEPNHFLRSLVLNNLNHDLILLSEISDSAASLHPSLASILNHKTRTSQMSESPGLLTLNLVVPNFSLLSWDTILEVRQLPAIREFRQKIMEIESMTRAALPDADIKDLQISIQSTMAQELLDEIENSHPTLLQATGNVAIDIFAGCLPIPGVSSGITAIREGFKLAGARKSWLAAFLRLTRRRR